MDTGDFERVAEGFVHAVEYCYRAGFDGVELHAAHGYLLAQFLANTTNKRTDQYGGALLNRARIILEISTAIRARVPTSFILSIKINSVEFQAGGFTTDDCRLLCVELEKHHFDFVELPVSGETYEAIAFTHTRESTKKRDAFLYVTIVGRMVQFFHGRVTAFADCHGAPGHSYNSLDFADMIVPELTKTRAYSGDDKEPLDLTREDHLQVFTNSMEDWFKVIAEDKDGFSYGWVKIEGMELQPYGVPYITTSSCP